jgi:hypothetical protein
MEVTKTHTSHLFWDAHFHHVNQCIRLFSSESPDQKLAIALFISLQSCLGILKTAVANTGID